MPQRLIGFRLKPLGCFLGAYLVGYGAWQLWGWGGEAHRSVIGDLAIIPPTILAAAACWMAGRRCLAVPRLRWAWRLIALAVLAYALGELAQLIYELPPGHYVFPSLADPLYLAFYPLFLAGILLFTRAPERSRSLRRALDVVTIAIGGAVVIWYLVLGPTAYSDTGGVMATVTSLAYPVGDLVLIVALAQILTEPATVQGRRSLQVLAAGLVVFVVADVIYDRLVLHGAYSGGSPIDSLWLTSMVIFAIAAARHLPDREEDRAFVETRRRPRAMRLALAPFLAVGVVFGLLIDAQSHDAFFPGLSLVLAAVLLGAFLSVRQLLAQTELLAAHEQLYAAHQELATLAGTDTTTGLPNERTLAAAIDGELARSRRYGHSCAVLFLDIDNFKNLNDGFGHAAGDEALREFSRIAERTLRSVDTCGRWGGDEFVALLPGVDRDAATKIAERLRAAVAEHAPSTHSVGITVSIGLAVYPDDGHTREQILAAADRALYEAKRRGRNRVSAAASREKELVLRDGKPAGYGPAPNSP